MAIKKFDIVCEPYGMEFLGLKWAKDSDREFDANFSLNGAGYSENAVYNMTDEFEDGFNTICKDADGRFYGVYLDSNNKPLIWREVVPTVELLPQVSFEAYLAGRENEWGEFECAHGYGVFNGDYPVACEHGTFIAGEHIEVIGDMGVSDGFWGTDIDAAKHYEECEGKKIIRDIPEIFPVYLDTPENRAKIEAQLERINSSLSDRLVDATDRANNTGTGIAVDREPELI